MRFVSLFALVLGAAPMAAQQSDTLDSAYFAAMTARSIGPAGMSGRIGAIDGIGIPSQSTAG